MSFLLLLEEWFRGSSRTCVFVSPVSYVGFLNERYSLYIEIRVKVIVGRSSR